MAATRGIHPRDQSVGVCRPATGRSVSANADCIDALRRVRKKLNPQRARTVQSVQAKPEADFLFLRPRRGRMVADEVRDKVIPVARSMGLDGLLDRMLAEKTTSLQVVHIDGDHGAQATITLPTLMRAYAEAAVDEARSKYRIDLDYTPESLTHVDGVMRSWTAELPTKRIERLYRRVPIEGEMVRSAKGWAAYVVEVILGSRPGGWAVGQR